MEVFWVKMGIHSGGVRRQEMKKGVLVVDNHPVMLTFMTTFLEREGYIVQTASDGLSALDILNGWVPDVIFVDLVMPNISGDKLCRIIRSMPELDRTQVIIMSGIAAEADLDFHALGADGCIAKGPFNLLGEHVCAALAALDRGDHSLLQERVFGAEMLCHREVTRELLTSKHHTEIILDHLSEGIIEITQEGKIIYANPKAVSLTGLPEEKLLGSGIETLFHLARGLSGQKKEQAENESDEMDEEAPFVILNDRELEIQLVPMGDEGSTVVILHDVSIRKRLQDQLQYAQKMEAIATLAGGVAHQFNNALFALTGNIELIQIGLGGEGRMEKYLAPMRSSIDRMTDLTGKLLAYAQEGKYKPTRTSLNKTITETLPLIQCAVNPCVEVKAQLDEMISLIEADPAQLQMVLTAVVANAAEAIEGQGRIWIKTTQVAVDPRLEGVPAHIHPGIYICLSVEDTGRGMEESIRQRIFEPFFSTKFQGRGLSMAAVYGIIKNHGGFILVKSDPGQGTRVKIYLPAKEHEETEGRCVMDQTPNGNGTILVIEDEEAVIDVSRAMLEHLGFNILEARTGSEALNVARSYNGPIDLALLDIGLPDMDGRKLYPLIKEVRPDIKAIVSSGYTIEGPAKEILMAGAEGWIQKPYTLQAFSEKVSEVLNGR
jgi:two-component system cell cycle sensor histidine kinase/response regulator CckA